MDENLSWRARLARNNINILNADGRRWYYEFMYHPYAGSTKWCKTYFDLPWTQAGEEDYEYFEQMNAEELMKEVSKLRRELER